MCPKKVSCDSFLRIHEYVVFIARYCVSKCVRISSAMTRIYASTFQGLTFPLRTRHGGHGCPAGPWPARDGIALFDILDKSYDYELAI